LSLGNVTGSGPSLHGGAARRAVLRNAPAIAARGENRLRRDSRAWGTTRGYRAARDANRNTRAKGYTADEDRSVPETPRITGNPFSEEDAQTDTVFKRRCLRTIHHPAWDKFFGNPTDPSTALVFGEKGSGKTALRLQAVSELERYNLEHPGERVFVISYDDFNPYLDHFRAAVRARDAAQALARWRLQDHMDAILAQGVTHLIDLTSSEKVDLSALSLDQRRDLLLLAALYDQSTGEPIERRWDRLRRRSGFRPLWSRRDLQIGFGTSLIVVLLLLVFPNLRSLRILPWFLLPIVLGWVYWGWRLARAEWFARDIRRGLRVLSRDPSALRWELLWFQPSELGGQPLPTALKTGGEERYELLRKFQGLLTALGYAGSSS